MHEIVDRFKGKKICVIGDVIADIYIYGMPYKLSREAPVVVVKYEEESLCPGSAGNTINNLVAMGAEVFPLTCLGSDEPGRRLIEYFEACGCVRLEGFIRHEGRTVTKTRILAGDTHTSKQQVIRVDRENELGVPEAVRAALMRQLVEIGPEMDAFIISDYEYGLVDEEIIEYVRDLAGAKIVVGDSRYNLSRFQGFTLIKPNESEAYEVAGMHNGRGVTDVGRAILEKLDIKALLITRGNKGMSLFLRDGSIQHIPISGSDEIADVTGAGDTVAAVITLALAAGADFYTASLIANMAAGIVVMKRGTATASPEELKRIIAASAARGGDSDGFAIGGGDASPLQ
jgi:rfaE bifunctional protein kinase chain/domain